MINLRIFQVAQFACCVLIFAPVQTPCFAQSNNTPSQQGAGADQQIPPAIAKELEAMRKRIDELEAELKSSKAPQHPARACNEREGDGAACSNRSGERCRTSRELLFRGTSNRRSAASARPRRSQGGQDRALL